MPMRYRTLAGTPFELFELLVKLERAFVAEDLLYEEIYSFRSHSQAYGFRHRFYTFRSRVREHIGMPGVQGTAALHASRVLDSASAQRPMACALRPGTWTITIVHAFNDIYSTKPSYVMPSKPEIRTRALLWQSALTLCPLQELQALQALQDLQDHQALQDLQTRSLFDLSALESAPGSMESTGDCPPELTPSAPPDQMDLLLKAFGLAPGEVPCDPGIAPSNHGPTDGTNGPTDGN